MDVSAQFDTEPDGEVLRNWLAQVPSCVVAVTAAVGDHPAVMVASSFLGVSLRPPVVGFCAQTTSSTWPLIRQAESIGISVLAEQHTSDVRVMAARFGDRLADVDVFVDVSGTPFISGATAWLQTTYMDEIPIGDHVFAALAVRGLKAGFSDPLIFHGGAFKGCAGLPPCSSG